MNSFLSAPQIACLTSLVAAVNDCVGMFPGYTEEP